MLSYDLDRRDYPTFVDESAVEIARYISVYQDIDEVVFVGVSMGGVAAVDIKRRLNDFLPVEIQNRVFDQLVMVSTPFPGGVSTLVGIGKFAGVLAAFAPLPDTVLRFGDWLVPLLSGGQKPPRLEHADDASEFLIWQSHVRAVNVSFTRYVRELAAMLRHRPFVPGELSGTFRRVAYIFPANGGKTHDGVVDCELALAYFRQAFAPQPLIVPIESVVRGKHEGTLHWPSDYWAAIKEVTIR